MEHSQTVNNNRLVLLLIAGIPLTMILAASWLWYFVIRGDLDLVGMIGTANRGTLVQPPRQLGDAALWDRDNLVADWHDEEPRWVLLVPSSGPACDASCESRLYLTRQIHIAMGKEFGRIGRAYFSDAAVADTTLAVNALSDDNPLPAGFGAYLDRDHRGLRPLRVDSDGFAGLFPEYLEDSSTWYLVDPAGWIMMSYDGQVSYRDVISDLKFLLKNSSG
jgi:hypothetical protein